MFSYNIEKVADETKFNEACRKIEENVTEIQKNKLLEDVDGTQIQIYYKDNKKIKLVNDYEVDAVYIDSEISLDYIFK